MMAPGANNIVWDHQRRQPLQAQASLDVAACPLGAQDEGSSGNVVPQLNAATCFLTKHCPHASCPARSFPTSPHSKGTRAWGFTLSSRS